MGTGNFLIAVDFDVAFLKDNKRIFKSFKNLKAIIPFDPG